jgi:hypothetical protein
VGVSDAEDCIVSWEEVEEVDWRRGREGEGSALVQMVSGGSGTLAWVGVATGEAVEPEEVEEKEIRDCVIWEDGSAVSS